MLLFLGAGASKSFGIPDTKGFINEFENVIGSNKIYTSLKETIPQEQLDMETLMTVMHDLSKPKEELLNSIAPHTTRFLFSQGSQASYFMENRDVKMACHDMLIDTKRIIREKCLTQVKEYRNDILQSYDKFFNALKINKALTGGTANNKTYPQLRIFTTNYDTCIETYFNTQQMELCDGSIPRFGELIFDVDTFTNSHDLELIKLHGSINLFVKDRKIRVLHAAGAVDTSTKTDLGEEYGDEFIIYPVESNTSTEMFQSPLIELLQVFRNRLDMDKTWIIIGSTFRDSTLASIMNDVIINTEQKNYPKVLHINPQAAQINEYLSSKGYKSLANVVQPLEYDFCGKGLVEELNEINLQY